MSRVKLIEAGLVKALQSKKVPAFTPSAKAMGVIREKSVTDSYTTGNSTAIVQGLYVELYNNIPNCIYTDLFDSQLHTPASANGQVHLLSASDGTDLLDEVSEGSPIPVKQSVISGATLDTKKLAVIQLFTRESSRSGLLPDLLQTGILADLSKKLNKIISDALGAVTASVADIDALATHNYQDGVLIISGADVKKLNVDSELWLNGTLRGKKALIDPALTAGTGYFLPINSVTLSDFGSNFDLLEEFTTHNEDGTPLPIVDASGTAASPVRSAFQTDTLGLKAIFENVGVSLAGAGIVKFAVA